MVSIPQMWLMLGPVAPQSGHVARESSEVAALARRHVGFF